jgi:putative peptide zinc metalloprotease protein
LVAHRALDLDAVSAEAFLSPSWYRVASLRPSLKRQAAIRRHRFRGEIWYVVQDPASGRFNRLTPAAYQLLGLMNGERTMAEVWDAAIDQLRDDTPGQEEVIQLLSQLHSADLLHCEVSPDSAELFERYTRQDRSRSKSNWRNPFSIRLPLWNPDKFLARTLPYLRPLFSRFGGFLYCVVVGYALVLAALHWPELTRNLADRALAFDNLIILWLCFPLVKLLHELGHAYATKAGGGEVHEMGILFLVFMPVPYVDATAASGFRSKWRRVLVGAAGMLVELLIAALCMLLWVAVEPGLLRAIAFNVILIAGVSTIVFNGNPLLRFDGYYILSDLIEIPNLAARGNRYWRYLLERHAFRMERTEPPAATPGERRWLLLYAPAAFVYRLFVLVAIVFYIASVWFFIGIALAIWGVITMLGLPVVKFVRYVLDLPRAARARRRAMSVSLITSAVVLAVVLFVPVPLRIQTEGVVWLPEEANVRAGADGFVRSALIESGAAVAPNTALIESHDPVVAAELAVLQGRIAELEAKLEQQLFVERVQAELTRKELAHETARYVRTTERAEQLVARSAVQGRFVVERPADLPGRFFRKGELFGYVIQDAPTIVRVVVSQDDIDLVRSRLSRIDVRLAERAANVYPATLVREVPAAKDKLPSAALSSEGGGQVVADPRDPKSGKTLATTFQYDLQLPPEASSQSYGGRVYVRLAFHPEPLAQQWYRRVRQAFLAQFHV